MKEDHLNKDLNDSYVMSDEENTQVGVLASKSMNGFKENARVNSTHINEKKLQRLHKNDFYATYFDKEFILYEPTKFLDDIFSVSFNFWFSKQCTICPYFYFIDDGVTYKTDMGAQNVQYNNYANITFGPFQKMIQQNRPTDVYIVIKNDTKIIFYKHHRIKDFNNYSFALANQNNSVNLNCMLISCASLPGYRSPAPNQPELYNKLTQTAKDISADYIISTGDIVYLEPLNITSSMAIQAAYSQLREYERLSGLFSNHSWVVCNDDHELSCNDGLSDGPLISVLRNSLTANFPTIAGISREYRADVRTTKDITFITLDTVSCRKLNSNGIDNNLFLSILGESQTQFLLQSLANAAITYGKNALCFILVGKSMFGTQSQATFVYCPSEREQILNGIISLGLRNVCFLCGDSHFSDVSEYKYAAGGLIIREIRCSAIGSRPRTAGDINNNRVENSLFTDNNFGSINISGIFNNYTISYSTHSTHQTTTDGSAAVDGVVYTYSWKTNYIVQSENTALKQMPDIIPNELTIFRQNRFAYLQEKYTADCARLYSNLVNYVASIQRARIRAVNKQRLIHNAINQYNQYITVLAAIFDQNKLAVENYVLPQININGNKKALLIGINYTGTKDELYGCINDVNSIKERITADGFTDITVLTDLTANLATRDNILAEFTNLLINSQKGDLLFFCYSGHGSYILDGNGDEADGRDELIVSCDLQGILDDELKALIQAHLKEGVTLFAMIDSCFSGSMLDLKYQYLDTLNYDNYTENDKQLDTIGNVFMISGCTDNQTSADAFINNMARGAMTWSLLEAIKENPGCSWRELIKSMRDKLKTSEFTQVPQFSSGTIMNIDSAIFI